MSMRCVKWAVLAAVFTVGCGGPAYVVMRQANPNPFRGPTTFALVPIDTMSMTIDDVPTAVWLAQSGRDGAALAGDLQRGEAVYQQNAARTAGGAIVMGNARFVIHSRVVSWKRGYFNYFTNPQTTLSVQVQVTTPNGAVLDDVWFTSRVNHSLYRPTPVQGLHVAMEECGENVGSYIAGRRLAYLHRARALAEAAGQGAHTPTM